MVRRSSSEVTLGCSLLLPWASVSPHTQHPLPVSTPCQAPLLALVSSNSSGDRHQPEPALGQGAPREARKTANTRTCSRLGRLPHWMEAGLCWASVPPTEERVHQLPAATLMLLLPGPASAQSFVAPGPGPGC